MCDIASAAGAVLSLGSMLANSSADSANSAARANVLNGSSQRQAGWDRENEAFNLNSRQGYDDSQGKMAKRAGEVSDFYGSQNGGLPVSGPTSGVIPASSSNIVNQEAKTQGDKVKAFGNQQNEALGKLRSFGDVLGGADRNTALNTANTGTINSIKRGDAGLNPMRLEEANHTGDGARQLGSILGTAGKIGISAGLSGAGGGAPLFGSGAPISSTMYGPTRPGMVNDLFSGGIF